MGQTDFQFTAKRQITGMCEFALKTKKLTQPVLSCGFRVLRGVRENECLSVNPGSQYIVDFSEILFYINGFKFLIYEAML